jgi:cystathionine gamma-synthase
MDRIDLFTVALHADRELAELPDVAPAIRPSTTFDEGASRRYRRASHETTERFEAVIGALEHGVAIAYGSGMAAAAAVIDYCQPPAISLPEVYHGVRALVEGERARGRLEIKDPQSLPEGGVDWIETPSNPRCMITDVSESAVRNRAKGVTTVVDSTFATPIGMNPLVLGADIVMHSATKAISGHSDSLGGVLVVADETAADDLRRRREVTGGVPGSLDVWLSLRGVRTLPLRFERACATAKVVADWAAGRGIDTFYPGLADHPGHATAARQMRAFGSMMAIDLGDAESASRVVSGVRVFRNATSLGGVESLIEHRLVSDPTTAPGLVRLSVGLEGPAALIDDLEQALG